MQIFAKKNTSERTNEEAQVTFIYEDESNDKILKNNGLKENNALKIYLQRLSEKGKVGTVHDIFSESTLQRHILVSLGNKSDYDSESLRKAISSAVRYCRDHEIKKNID